MLQDSWYTWVSLLLFILFAGFWMSRYSKGMKLFPVLIIMPVIQVSLPLGGRGILRCCAAVLPAAGLDGAAAAGRREDVLGARGAPASHAC